MRIAAIATGFALVLNACTAPGAPPAAKLTAQDIKGLWAEILSAGRPCDEAGKEVADAADRKNVYDMYAKLSAGIEACRDASMKTTDIKPPAAAYGEVKDAFEKVIQTCSYAHLSRQVAFEAMAKVVDGDQRPSAVSAAQTQAERSQMGQMACVAGFMEATGKTDIEIAEVFGDDDPAKPKAE